MNYRHAFHAGNFADVLKHMVLCACLRRLMQKDKGLRLIDLFAGIGWYDLSSNEAIRSPEWQAGIARLQAAAHDTMPVLVRDYLADTAATLQTCGLPSDGFYPGSPAYIRHFMRAQDNAIFCELHPLDSQTLDERLGYCAGIVVEQRDGWQAVRAYLPPPSRRGLVLIDPPFEQLGEFERMGLALQDGLERFANGTYLLWYADKDHAVTQDWRDRIAQMEARCLDIRLSVAGEGVLPGLCACGVLVVNPPYGLEEGLSEALPWLCVALARGAGADWAVERLSGTW